MWLLKSHFYHSGCLTDVSAVLHDTNFVYYSGSSWCIQIWTYCQLSSVMPVSVIIQITSPRFTWWHLGICLSEPTSRSLQSLCAVYWTEAGLRVELRLALSLLLKEVFLHFHSREPCQWRTWVRQGFVVEKLGSHTHTRQKRSVPALRTALAWHFFFLKC